MKPAQPKAVKNAKAIPPELLRRELPRIDHITDKGCWLLPNKPDEDGYVKLHRRLNGKLVTVRAARLFYWKIAGPIPLTHEIDHLCDNKPCVRPKWSGDMDGHTLPALAHANLLRSNGPSAVNARKTKCLRRHVLAGDNLLATSDGRRVCRLCSRIRSRRSVRGR